MKITKSQLKRLIKEELKETLKEIESYETQEIPLGYALDWLRNNITREGAGGMSKGSVLFAFKQSIEGATSEAEPLKHVERPLEQIVDLGKLTKAERVGIRDDNQAPAMALEKLYYAIDRAYASEKGARE
jgi:hypothetical protein